MSDWGFPNFDAHFDADNDPRWREEQPDDDDPVICDECGERIPEDEPRWERGLETFCDDCFIPDPDPFDDSEFDATREDE